MDLKLVCRVSKNGDKTGYELYEDFEVTVGNHTINVPKGFFMDGASIPFGAWGIIGTPYDPPFMVASVVHDWLYYVHTVPRETADELFYQLLLQSGVGKAKAYTMKKAVNFFGKGHWENTSEDINYLKSLHNA